MVVCNYGYRNYDEIYLNGLKGNNSTSHSISTSLIVGSVVGAVFIFLFISSGLIYIYKRIKASHLGREEEVLCMDNSSVLNNTRQLQELDNYST